MKLRNKGYTLLEILIAVAMLAIFASLLLPLGTAYTKSHKKITEINDLDMELSKTVEVIKRAIRAAQEDDSENNAILHPPDDISSTSSSLTLIVRGDSDYEYVTFWLNADEFRVTSEDTITTASGLDLDSDGSVLMNDVEAVEFKYSENIVTMYFKLKKGGVEREIRDAGVTRIDYQISKKITEDLSE